MNHFIKKISISFSLFIMLTACANHKNNMNISLIDSTKTKFIEYTFDEQYYLETIYYDCDGLLLKTVKYDDLAPSVIYNVRNKKTITLKANEAY